MPRDAEKDAVNSAAHDATRDYLARSAKVGCETAIGLMLTCMSMEDVVDFLEKQAANLKQYG